MTSDLYPGLSVSIQFHDGRDFKLYYIASIAVHDNRLRIWFLDHDNEEHSLEFDLTLIDRFDVSLNTGDPE